MNDSQFLQLVLKAMVGVGGTRKEAQLPVGQGLERFIKPDNKKAARKRQPF